MVRFTDVSVKIRAQALSSNTELYIEHLDSKRFSIDDSSLFTFISRKYSNFKFD
jgi:hypothetical protein